LPIRKYLFQILELSTYMYIISKYCNVVGVVSAYSNVRVTCHSVPLSLVTSWVNLVSTIHRGCYQSSSLCSTATGN
jgi:hypothetical protein